MVPGSLRSGGAWPLGRRWIAPLGRPWIVALASCLLATTVGTGPVRGVELAASAPRMPLAGELEAAAGLVVPDAPEVEELPDLGTLSELAFDLAESMPAEHWNLDALAEALLYDPLAAFRFVRDHIRYEPYRGVLRGPEGTLAARAGNSLDRSLLLAALLDRMLVDHRFATARLDDAALAAAMGAARQGPPLALDGEPPGARIAVEAIGARARRDFARLAQALGPSFPAEGGTDEAAALEDAREHVWLRIPFGAEWLDLDPTLPDAEPGEALVPVGSESPEAPADLRHLVSVRLVVESVRDDRLSESVVLEQGLDAVEAADRRIFLYFQPDLSGIGGAILDVLSGDEQWVPVLLVDDEGVAGRPFSAGGAATDLLGDPTELPELVSLRLVVTTTSPGGQAEEASHVLYDRRPAEALRGVPGSPITEEQLEPLLMNDGAPLALAGIYHLMVSTGGASPRTYAYYQSQAADLINDGLLDEETAGAYSFADRLWPLAVADQGMVVASEQVLVPAAGGSQAHGYVARPRVYLTSMAPDPSDPATLTLTTDLLVDGVRLLPLTPGGPTASMQVWYGTLQAALETELGLLRTAAVAEPGGADVASASLLMDEPVAVLDGDASVEPGSGAHPALVADLAAGRIVVAPGDVASAESWWSVEPASGVTRAMLSPGLRGYRDVSPGSSPARPVLETSKSKFLYGGPKGPPPGGKPPFRPGPYRPVGPASARPCGPNEYLVILVCVSLPQAIVLWSVGAAFVIVITWCAQTLWTFWLHG